MSNPTILELEKFNDSSKMNNIGKQNFNYIGVQ